MKHVAALLIKYVMITLILEIVLMLLSGLSFGSVLWISFIVTIAAYLIGDLLIVPVTSNTVATLTDIGLIFVLVYMFNFLWKDVVEIPLLSAIAVALMIGIGEWYFHKHIRNYISD